MIDAIGSTTSTIRASVFFFNDTATTEIYTLSLHDALPISWPARMWLDRRVSLDRELRKLNRNMIAFDLALEAQDRKSTRLNSSHSQISYAVFCLKKKPPTSRPALLSAKHLAARPQRARLEF